MYGIGDFFAEGYMDAVEGEPYRPPLSIGRGAVEDYDRGWFRAKEMVRRWR